MGAHLQASGSLLPKSGRSAHHLKSKAPDLRVVGLFENHSRIGQAKDQPFYSFVHKKPLSLILFYMVFRVKSSIILYWVTKKFWLISECLPRTMKNPADNKKNSNILKKVLTIHNRYGIVYPLNPLRLPFYVLDYSIKLPKNRRTPPSVFTFLR